MLDKLHIMFNRWFQPHKRSFLLVGPRRSGKTTWLRRKYPDYTYRTLDDFDDLGHAKADPKGFVRSLGSQAIIDEVQRFPELLVAVKQALDAGQVHILMTGSSQMKLLAHGTETLAGRIDVFHFPTLCWGESLGSATHRVFQDQVSRQDLQEGQRALDEALEFGGFPEVVAAASPDDKNDVLHNYKNTYFTRDLASLSGIENLDGLAAVLLQHAQATGSLLEVSSFAREAGLSFETTKKYLNVLRMSDLTFDLKGFELGPAKRYIKAKKFYFADVGVITALGSQISQGARFELFVISELEKRRKLGGFTCEFFCYSRSVSGAEVDVIIESPKELVAIEIKSSAQVRAGDIENLVRFARETRTKKHIRPFCIYGGLEYREIRGVQLIPVAVLHRGF